MYFRQHLLGLPFEVRLTLNTVADREYTGESHVTAIMYFRCESTCAQNIMIESGGIVPQKATLSKLLLQLPIYWWTMYAAIQFLSTIMFSMDHLSAW